MASTTGWTWVWASSGKWWRTGKPGVLQSMGSPRVRHDCVTEQQMRTSTGTVAWRLERTRVQELEAVSLGVMTSCIWELCMGIWRWLQVVCSSWLGSFCRWCIHQLRKSQRKSGWGDPGRVSTGEVGSPILSHGNSTFGESSAQQRGHTLCPLDRTGDVLTCVHWSTDKEWALPGKSQLTMIPGPYQCWVDGP